MELVDRRPDYLAMVKDRQCHIGRSSVQARQGGIVIRNMCNVSHIESVLLTGISKLFNQVQIATRAQPSRRTQAQVTERSDDPPGEPFISETPPKCTSRPGKILGSSLREPGEKGKKGRWEKRGRGGPGAQSRRPGGSPVTTHSSRCPVIFSRWFLASSPAAARQLPSHWLKLASSSFPGGSSSAAARQQLPGGLASSPAGASLPFSGEGKKRKSVWTPMILLWAPSLAVAFRSPEARPGWSFLSGRKDCDVKIDITGVLYHESTHIWQWDENGKAPGGLIEGIVEFVRLKTGYAPNHWVQPSQGDRWDQGYDVTPRFLDYCTSLKAGLLQS
ncbi:hypothetical protein ACLB2K_012782 [Fragaria x ananassa]